MDFTVQSGQVLPASTEHKRHYNDKRIKHFAADAANKFNDLGGL